MNKQAEELFNDYKFNDNPTGRMITENGFGDWTQVNNQFISGKKISKELPGALYPTESKDRLEPPQDRVIFGYSRIGYDWKTK